MSSEYKVSNATGMAPGESAACMQYKKLLNALEVRDDNGTLGYLHLLGPCKEQWGKSESRFFR